MDAKRLEKKLQHWQQIIISAAQQSWRCELPKLNTPVSFAESLEAQAEQNIIFDVHSTQALEKSAADHSSINCWIGPEGGFSVEEVEQSTNAHMLVASLGPRILRTETATVTAISLLQYFAGDLK
jgi:16S rRNA (uracil1498-N3)-methyltransferase